MPPRTINRRDFLKFIGVSPVMLANWSILDKFEKPFPENNITAESPNILIVVFDALSAAHMSLYGYGRQTTPHIEQASRKALVFHRHYAGGNFTTPGIVSLLTGVYPWSHRALHLYGEVDRSYIHRQLFRLFQGSHNTLAYSHNAMANYLLYQFNTDIHQLKDRKELALASFSYSDTVFKNDHNKAYDGELLLFREQNIDPPAAFFLYQIEHLRRYLTRRTLSKSYERSFPRGVPAQSPDLLFTLEQAIDWIIEQVHIQRRPSLIFAHLFPPHDPYHTRSDFINKFDDGWHPISKPEHFFSLGHSQEYMEQERRLYDEYIAYLDSEFGRLFDHIERTGVLDSTFLIFTADHGEMFERGILNHITPTLYESIIRIPLLIWAPGKSQRKDVFITTSCVDILPTLLHVTHQHIPTWCQGQVLPNMGGEENSNRCVFSIEAKSNPKQTPLRTGTVALLKGNYKLIHYFGYPNYDEITELYDLDNDPEELMDLYKSKKSLAEELRFELQKEILKSDLPPSRK